MTKDRLIVTPEGWINVAPGEALNPREAVELGNRLIASGVTVEVTRLFEASLKAKGEAVKDGNSD